MARFSTGRKGGYGAVFSLPFFTLPSSWTVSVEGQASHLNKLDQRSAFVQYARSSAKVTWPRPCSVLEQTRDRQALREGESMVVIVCRNISDEPKKGSDHSVALNRVSIDPAAPAQ
jgi:hypothetical protein